jgi:hypothetical protein
MTTIEQAKCTVGNKQYYSSTEIINGHFVEYTHTVETVRVLEILQAAGEATVTHTGGYGRKKFILNNIEFTTESGTRSGEKAIAIGTDSTCINYTNVVFDREDWEYLHKSFIHRGPEKKNVFWLDMTEIGPGE